MQHITVDFVEQSRTLGTQSLSQSGVDGLCCLGRGARRLRGIQRRIIRAREKGEVWEQSRHDDDDDDDGDDG